MNEIINELYELYEQKVIEASGMFKSEWSSSSEQDHKRDEEDNEDLEYFKALLRKIR